MHKCESCGDEFEATRSDARFCSAACRKANSRDIGINGRGEMSQINLSDDPAVLEAEADRLVQLQRDHRGQVPGPVIDGKKTMLLGPYEATPETEERAARILGLRKRAAALRYPTARELAA